MNSLKQMMTFCSIDNKSSFVWAMAWRWTGDEPLPEPMMTQFSDTSLPLRGVNNILGASEAILINVWKITEIHCQFII